jgi:hypothetical protein
VRCLRLLGSIALKDLSRAGVADAVSATMIGGGRFSKSGLGIDPLPGSRGPPTRRGGWVPAACSRREHWVLRWITEQPLHAGGLSLPDTQRNPNYSRIGTCRRLQSRNWRSNETPTGRISPAAPSTITFLTAARVACVASPTRASFHFLFGCRPH